MPIAVAERKSYGDCLKTLLNCLHLQVEVNERKSDRL